MKNFAEVHEQITSEANAAQNYGSAIWGLMNACAKSNDKKAIAEALRYAKESRELLKEILAKGDM